MDIIEMIDCHDNRRCVNYTGKHFNKEYGCELYKSLAICHDVQFAVVTNSVRAGYGVYGWHCFKEHAEHNAKVVGGRVIPVDRMNDEVILPSLAARVIEGSMDSYFGNE